MDFTKQGDAAVNAMTLIQQLEEKVREKNKIIDELEDERELHAEYVGKIADAMSIPSFVEPSEDILDYVAQWKKRIMDLQEESMQWRTKFILSTMLNWANPIPLVSGTVFGGTVGWAITWLVMRRHGV